MSACGSGAVGWRFERLAGGFFVVVLPLLRLVFVFAAETPLLLIGSSASIAALEIASCMADCLGRGPLFAMAESDYELEGGMLESDVVIWEADVALQLGESAKWLSLAQPNKPSDLSLSPPILEASHHAEFKSPRTRWPLPAKPAVPAGHSPPAVLTPRIADEFILVVLSTSPAQPFAIIHICKVSLEASPESVTYLHYYRTPIRSPLCKGWSLPSQKCSSPSSRQHTRLDTVCKSFSI